MDHRPDVNGPVQLFASENEQAEKYIDEGNLPEAARFLVQIVDKDPGNWRAFCNMGLISWNRRAWADAYAMFEKSVCLKPDYVDGLINLFDAAIKLRRVKEILPYFERALFCDPTLEEVKVIVDSIREQGDGIYLSQRALVIGTSNPRIDEANKLLEEGNLFKAMEKYLAINDGEGPNAEAFCGLGIISYYQKRYEDAFSLFMESIKLNPVLPDTFLNFLDAARECGREEDARKVYLVYAKEFPSLQAIAGEFGIADQ